jgi:hypothetical protein
MWEDWEDSGTLQLSFKERSEGGEGEALDAIWEYLLFSLVGNQLDAEVIGLCFNKHPKQTLVDLWLRSAGRRTEITTVLERVILRDVEHLRLKLKREIRFKYVEHRHNLKVSSMRFRVNIGLCNPYLIPVSSQPEKRNENFIIPIFICSKAQFLNS